MRTAHFTIISIAPDGSPTVYRAPNRKEWQVQTQLLYLAGHTEICASEFVEYRLLGVSFSRHGERYLRCRNRSE